ncbi:MAG: hypothetical protein MR270_05255 [Erysipelotrichaceae bacterium]|nr:hypothetical protein [Erysipelotrichaceae bacterium]
MKIKGITLVSLLSILLLSCESNRDDSSSSINSNDSLQENDSSSSEDTTIQNDELFNEYYNDLIFLDDIKKDENKMLMYDEDEFGPFNDGKFEQLYVNNEIKIDFKDGQGKETDDLKYLYYNNDTMRFVNRSEGYAFNIKTNTTYQADFSIAACRSRLYNEQTTICVSKETKNPYNTWLTYRDDWLIRYINSEEYLNDNNLQYTDNVIIENKNILANYYVSMFSIKINNPGNIRKMFYNIAILRNEAQYNGKEFYLIVMKSNNNRNDDFKELVQSFMEIPKNGSVSNHIDNLPLKNNPLWDENTKKYFEKFSTQQRTDWGIYTYGIEQVSKVTNKMNEFEEAMDYEFDIMPTYLHTTSNGRKIYFDDSCATTLAGGNGFNGKKVLQLSYQFTNNNNTVRGNDLYTPMFDILRGPLSDSYEDSMTMQNKVDDVMHSLAEKIKSYKEPLLFRLNNEMNSDWVSYCGMITLLDPDIFIATWRKLYNIFQEHEVTNAIWIFNPILDSCPYSAWGEDLSYFPGVDYVQALGLTAYRDNNNNDVNSLTFRKDYTRYYEKNIAVWRNYPWIISEFGCGAGGDYSGERYRNQQSQANYVIGMFADFKDRENNPYLQNIKGAIWFSANDYEDGKVKNQYELVVDKLPLTMEAFKEGLKINK